MRRLLLSACIAILLLIGTGIGYGLHHHTVERIVERHTVSRIEEKPHVRAVPAPRHHAVRRPVHRVPHRLPGDDSANQLNHQQISSRRAYGPTTYHGEQLCKDEYGRLQYFPPRGALCARPTWAI